jgi:hypothetical protein
MKCMRATRSFPRRRESSGGAKKLGPLPELVPDLIGDGDERS